MVKAEAAAAAVGKTNQSSSPKKEKQLNKNEKPHLQSNVDLLKNQKALPIHINSLRSNSIAPAIEVNKTPKQ